MSNDKFEKTPFKAGDVLEGSLIRPNHEERAMEARQARMYILETNDKGGRAILEVRLNCGKSLSGRGPAKCNSQTFRDNWDKIDWNGNVGSQGGSRMVH